MLLPLCCSTANAHFQHTASCVGSELLPCGSVQGEHLDGYLSRLGKLLSNAQQLHDEQRSSHGSKRQGHQMTPALLHALALQVQWGLQGQPDGRPERAAE